MSEEEANAGNGGTTPPFGDAEGYREAETKVLFPDTHRRRVIVAGKEIHLRPMVYKTKRLVIELFKPALRFAGEPDEGALLVEMEDAVVEAIAGTVVAVLASYGVPDLSKDWVFENFSEGEMLDLVNAQLALERENDFSLRAVRRLLDALPLLEEALQAQVDLRAASIQGKPSPSPATAKPGEPASPNSSEATPRDSSA